MELSYQTLKVTHQAREAVRKHIQKRTVPGTRLPVLLQAELCVSGCYGDKVHRPSGASALKSSWPGWLNPGAGLEVVILIGWIRNRQRRVWE